MPLDPGARRAIVPPPHSAGAPATTVNSENRLSRQAAGSLEKSFAKNLFVEREFQHQPLFNEGRGRVHGKQSMRLDALFVACNIDHGDDLATQWIANRSRGADPSLPGLNVVPRLRQSGQARSLGQRRPTPLVPAACSFQLPPVRKFMSASLFDNPPMADCGEDVPVSIAQSEHVLGIT